MPKLARTTGTRYIGDYSQVIQHLFIIGMTVMVRLPWDGGLVVKLEVMRLGHIVLLEVEAWSHRSLIGKYLSMECRVSSL
jgi:hypothetical protein